MMAGFDFHFQTVTSISPLKSKQPSLCDAEFFCHLCGVMCDTDTEPQFFKSSNVSLWTHNNCETIGLWTVDSYWALSISFYLFQQLPHSCSLPHLQWKSSPKNFSHDELGRATRSDSGKIFSKFHLLLDSESLQRLHLDSHSLVPFPKHSTANKLNLCKPLNKTIWNIFHQMKNVIVHLKLKPTLQFDQNIWRVLPLYWLSLLWLVWMLAKTASWGNKNLLSKSMTTIKLIEDKTFLYLQLTTNNIEIITCK